MDWFRSYHGAPSDTKLALIAIKSGQPRAFVTAVWWEVLDHASRNVTQRGDVSHIDPEIIAHQQGIPPDAVQAILNTMSGTSERDLIVNGRVTNWDKRQVKREDPQATERKRKERERRHAMSRDVTQASHNVTTEEIRGEEKREEKTGEERKGAKEKSPADYAFFGKVIRLNHRDFCQWQQTYHAIPDLKAELAAIDVKFATDPPQDWYGKLSGWLNKKHQDFLRQRKPPAGTKSNVITV